MIRYALRLAAIYGIAFFLLQGMTSHLLSQEPQTSNDTELPPLEEAKPEDPPKEDQPKDPSQPWPSPWVTAISPVPNTENMFAASADGLLMREAFVVRFQKAELSRATPVYSHPASVWAVVASESVVSSSDYRGNLRIFDLASSEVQTHDGVFERWTRALAYSPDGKSLIAGNEAGKIFVWSLEAGKVIQSADVDNQQIYSLAFSPDGNRLAVSNGAGHVHVLAWPALTPVRKLEVGEQPVWGAVFTNDGEAVVAGGADRKLWLAPLAEGAPASVLIETGDWIAAIQKSADGKNIVAGTFSGELILASGSSTSGMIATSIATLPSGIWSVSMPTSDAIFAGTRKHAVASLGQAWDVRFAEEPGVDPPADEEGK